jgi:hypothetical protein
MRKNIKKENLLHYCANTIKPSLHLPKVAQRLVTALEPGQQPLQ